jgi:hypothetical protein
VAQSLGRTTGYRIELRAQLVERDQISHISHIAHV